jgi:hypothetical protein
MNGAPGPGWLDLEGVCGEAAAGFGEVGVFFGEAEA